MGGWEESMFGVGSRCGEGEALGEVELFWYYGI